MLVIGRFFIFGTQDKDGYTPAHFGAREGNQDCLQVLLEHRANPDIQAKDGTAPIHLALKR